MWPLVQVTGISSLPGPIRQVYSPSPVRPSPAGLYVYAGTYHCYVAYRPAGTVVFGRRVDDQQNAVSIVHPQDVFHPGETIAMAAYFLRPTTSAPLTEIITGGPHRRTRAETVRTDSSGYAALSYSYGPPAAANLFPGRGIYRMSFLQGHTVLATGTMSIEP